jgi:hypothetical protein
MYKVKMCIKTLICTYIFFQKFHLYTKAMQMAVHKNP